MSDNIVKKLVRKGLGWLVREVKEEATEAARQEIDKRLGAGAGQGGTIGRHPGSGGPPG